MYYLIVYCWFYVFYNNIYIMNDDGYIVLKRVLTPKQLQTGLNTDYNGVIDYKMMKQFIDNDIIPSVIQNTKFMKKPKYIKFRYSNNNNSTDASTFHSDVYDYTNNEIMPIFSCLCYFDKTQLIVIPGSHKKQFQKDNSSISSYRKKRIVTIEPGDILIFHANLYHRGTHFDSQANRRLLQVFEIFPDDETFLSNYDKFLTVITANTVTLDVVNNISYHISKIPFIIDNICFLHYVLVYNDLQYKLGCNDLLPWDKNDKRITYEPGKRIKYESITGRDPINTNIICENSKTTEPDLLSFIFYIIYWITLVCVIYYAVKFMYTRVIIRFIRLYNKMK